MSFFDNITQIFSSAEPFIKDLERELTRNFRADMFEKDDCYVVVCELPGVDKSNIEIKLDDRRLTITGTRKSEYYADFIIDERAKGDFHRVFSLPRAVDSSSASSTLDNGLLTVYLTKDNRTVINVEIK